MTKLPMISIVMPSYNQCQFIERSIRSVLDQEYPNLDFIVIDGGSSDGTVDIIRKYEGQLSCWISEPDRGQSDALNKGFARARGDIMGWLNSDDLYMPLAFARAASSLAERRDKKIVHGDWVTIDASDRQLTQEYAFDFSLNQFKYEGFHLNAQSMFWRREVHERFGKFDESLYNTMDYEMILSFGINEGDQAFLRVPWTLGCFRRHEAQKTRGFDARVLGEQRLIADKHGYNDKYRARGRALRLAYRFRRAYWYLKRGGPSYFMDKLVHGS